MLAGIDRKKTADSVGCGKTARLGFACKAKGDCRSAITGAVIGGHKGVFAVQRLHNGFFIPAQIRQNAGQLFQLLP